MSSSVATFGEATTVSGRVLHLFFPRHQVEVSSELLEQENNSMSSTKRALQVVGAIASVFGVVATGLPSFAAATKDAGSNVVVSGLTNYGSYAVEYTGVPKVKRASANACGVISLRDSASYPVTSTSSFTRGGTTYIVSSLTVGPTPKCVNGSLQETPSATVFRDSNGVVFFTGLTAYSSHEITFNSVSTIRRAKANACGMISLKNSVAYPLSNRPISIRSVSGSGAIGSEVESFTPSTLTASDTPICRQGKTYFPEGWTGGGVGGGAT